MLARSFACLIHRLVDRVHHGNELAMARRSKIPQSTIWRWHRSVPGIPSVALIRRLADTYHLPLREVGRLVARDFLRRLLGQPIPAPFLDDKVKRKKR